MSFEAVPQAVGAVVLPAMRRPVSAVPAVDAAVQTMQRVRDMKDVKLAGGAGTDMGVRIARALAGKPTTQTAIALTDGYTPWPEVPAVAWVIAGIFGRDREVLPSDSDCVQRVEVVTDG